MQDFFITKIHIDKVRHLSNVDIVLSQDERKHLIITGKNGSGKTSLLQAIRDYIIVRCRKDSPGINPVLQHYLYSKEAPEVGYTPGVSVDFSVEKANLTENTFAYLSAERSEFALPKSVEPVEINAKTMIIRNASKEFLKYILNLYVQYLSVKDLGKSPVEIERYKAWFDNFENALRDIYNCPELNLKPDMKKLKFLIEIPGREPFGLHQMSDGYKAFIEIMMELLMRFETADGVVDYNKSAIVFIDEIETHLHVELQKRALPFLTSMFPQVQFIVATHSPLVITSLSDAVVYDLEKNETLLNPTRYSLETIVESFLDTDMYSAQLKKLFNRYKQLCFIDRTPDQNKEFLRIKTELEFVPPASKELYNEFSRLEEQRKRRNNGQNQ